MLRITPWLLAVLLTGSCLAQEEELETPEIRYMLRGYFYAGTSIKDPNALGGFGSSDNLPREAPAELLRDGELRLLVQPDQEVAFSGKYRGMRVFLLNGTDAPAEFAASDSRLSIVQEARDSEGVWKPIEYLPSSWCGNSYHKVFLAPGTCWEFAAPRFDGAFETELRFRLEREAGDLVSNTFPGRIHPEQFEVKRPYEAQGLMDPYED